MPLAEGFFFGILLSLMIGPVFFILLQTSLEKGKVSGLTVALGAAMSDIVILSLCFFGLMTMASNGFFGKVLGYAGVIVLVISGYSRINRPKTIMTFGRGGVKDQSPGQFFVKGFLVNMLNPFVFVFWMGVVGFLTKKYATSSADILQFILGVFAAIQTFDLIKVFLSAKVRPHLKSSNLRIISMLTGVILISYGILLFYKML